MVGGLKQIKKKNKTLELNKDVFLGLFVGFEIQFNSLDHLPFIFRLGRRFATQTQITTRDCCYCVLLSHARLCVGYVRRLANEMDDGGSFPFISLALTCEINSHRIPNNSDCFNSSCAHTTKRH